VWFEVAVVAVGFAVGNILLGHFDEGTPRWRRVAKLFLALGIAAAITTWAGRPWFWVWLIAMTIPPLVIHLWWLPRRGINGWTGEPRQKYYELRGWKWPPRA
jgi:hypothetical protein